ncbi:MAG: hypothetical protein WC467_03635 [Patescibacteria group bacterium]
MKKIKHFYILSILFFVLFPFFLVSADIAPMGKVNSAADFNAWGGGKCVYYSGGGCSSGQWLNSDKSNCAWEPCCKQHLDGYPANDFIYRFATLNTPCVSKTGLTETIEPDQTKCVNPNFDCCCPGAPIIAQQSTVEEKKAIYTPPDLQVKIPGMEKLSTISCDETGQCEIPWLGQYVIGIYNYALSIVGILAAIMLMAGGLLWLISAGDASKITQAKELITGSVTGLIILAASFIILVQINPNLVNFNALSLSSIKRVDLGDAAWTPIVSTKQSVAAYCGCVDWHTLYAGSNLKSASAIKAKLAGSPLESYSDLVASACQQTQIDPALVLIIWRVDSIYATAGPGKKNNNPGNVRCGEKKSGNGWTCVDNFRHYDNLAIGITDWFVVVGQGKRLSSSKNIRELIKTYAPPSDHNDTQAYINLVMSAIDSAHGGQLKTTDGSAASLQKCTDINSTCP